MTASAVVLLGSFPDTCRVGRHKRWRIEEPKPAWFAELLDSEVLGAQSTTHLECEIVAILRIAIPGAEWLETGLHAWSLQANLLHRCLSNNPDFPFLVIF
eukprot:14099-Amphidinium_carterae.2